jgi:hypothetical protein
MKGQSKEDER